MKDSYNESLHEGAFGKLYQYCKELRQSETTAEKILWKCLRGRKFHGLKFRRQHPLHKYIADFYCHEKKLVIELDGEIHSGEINENYDRDEVRKVPIGKP